MAAAATRAVEATEPPQPTEATPPVSAEQGQHQLSEAQQSDRMEEIARVYYRSMAFYRAGRLSEARAGFVEVIESGLIPPPMRETLEGYLKDIDGRLQR